MVPAQFGLFEDVPIRPGPPADFPPVGTCSWNYPSWQGLVYSARRRSAAEYLEEYAQHYPTVEIDSWFYHAPERREVLDYQSRVPSGFRFSAKLGRQLSQPFLATPGQRAAAPNPDWLSVERYEEFLERTAPLHGQMTAFMLECEYLNQDKMASLEVLMEALDGFLARAARPVPLAIELRNRQWMRGEWFDFLRAHGIGMVFSEKRWMPPVAELHGRFAERLPDLVIIRLLGDDRAAIERSTGKRWDTIVEPKPDKPRIVAVSRDLVRRGKTLVINVNNHYEGSAPLTIDWLRAHWQDPAPPAGELAKPPASV